MTEEDLKLAIKAVKAAKKLGVRTFKLGTLEFELEEKTPRGRPALKVSRKEQDRLSDEQLSLFKAKKAQDELSTMHVSDPLGFERAIIENDLIDGISSGEDIEKAFDS